MYGGYDFIEQLDYSIEEKILLLEKYLEFPIEIEKKILSPLRGDKNPKAYFIVENDEIYLIDYASPDGRSRKKFIEVIAEYTRTTTFEAMLNLRNHILPTTLLPKIITETTKEYYPIFTTKRDWQIRDKNYWLPYGISKENLEEDNVFPISEFAFYSRNRKNWIIEKCKSIAYCIPGYNRCKIYLPKNKDLRFISNFTPNHIGGRHYDGEVALISKSYKDHRVLKNAGLKNYWFQNEGAVPSKKVLLSKLGEYKEIHLWFDNDKAGIEASNRVAIKLRECLGVIVKQIILTDTRYKDPADYVKAGKNIKEYYDVTIKSASILGGTHRWTV